MRHHWKWVNRFVKRQRTKLQQRWKHFYRHQQYRQQASALRLDQLEPRVLLSAGTLSGTFDVDAPSGSRITHTLIEDGFGEVVASAGDVNGDGIDDLLISASESYRNGTDSGEVYLLYGKDGEDYPDMYSSNITSGNYPGAIFRGIDENDRLGISIASAGDVNGDGFDDILIAGFYANSLNYHYDQVYLIYGSADGLSGVVDLAGIEAGTLAGAILKGTSNSSWAGLTVNSAGDVNADGFADFMIGASGFNGDEYDSSTHHIGATYLIYGSETDLNGELNLSDIATGDLRGSVFYGTNQYDYSGSSIATAGDVNHDGLADFLIGVAESDINGTDSGMVYLIYGQNDDFDLEINLSDIQSGTRPGAYFSGISQHDQLGISVSSAGDVNGDGYADILLGANQAQAGEIVEGGQTYLIYGRQPLISGEVALAQLQTSSLNYAVFNGAQAGEKSGTSVSSAGDVNGDGYADILIGSPGYDVNSYYRQGRTFLVYGVSNMYRGQYDLSTIDDGMLPGAIMVGESYYDQIGFSVASAGDINGDGLSDILVGTHRYEFKNNTIGKAYILYGRESSIISGQAWEDINANGVRDVGEEGLPGIRVVNDCTRYGSYYTESTYTDAHGYYYFCGLYPDPYKIYINVPDWLLFAEQNVGDDDTIDSDVDSNTGASEIITINARENVHFVDAGLTNPVPVADAGDDYVIAVGDWLQLSAYRSSDFGDEVNTFQWDLDNDGQYDDATGINPTVSWQTLDDLGLTVGQYSISVKVTDSYYHSDTATVTLTINAKVENSVVDLSTLLDGTLAGMIFNGATQGDQIGTVLNSAGDVNGDGYDDFLIRTFQGDSQGDTDDIVYLIYGQPSLFAGEMDANDIGTHLTGAVFTGLDPADEAGVSIASAGDVNGDGFDDFLIGEDTADITYGDDGRAFLIYGKATGLTGQFDLNEILASDLDAAVFNSVMSFSNTGFAVSSAGDVNGDGYDDLLIGAPKVNTVGSNDAGEAYLVYGKATGLTGEISLSELYRWYGLDGARFEGGYGYYNSGSHTGICVTPGGDFNGDGIDDFLISTSGAGTSGIDYGAVAVVFGGFQNHSYYPTTLEMISYTTAGLIRGVNFLGIDDDDMLGTSIDSAGDVNGDGFDDLILSTWHANEEGTQTGETYLIYGSSDWTGTHNLSEMIDGSIDGAVFYGVYENDQSGYSVSGIGDVNGDGYDDLLIGAPMVDHNGEIDTGAAYLVLGQAQNLNGQFSLADISAGELPGYLFHGLTAGDHLGMSVTALGDINGDGFADFMIGAPGTTVNGMASAGQAYLIYGVEDFNPAHLSLGNYVWEDTNGNGIQDENEPGIAGVIINLLDSDQNVIATKLSNSRGGYTFTGLPDGEYAVEFVLPDGYVFSTPGMGEDRTIDSDANTSTGRSDWIQITADQANIDIDAGMQRLVTVSGIVYDTDHPGTPIVIAVTSDSGTAYTQSISANSTFEITIPTGAAPASVIAFADTNQNGLLDDGEAQSTTQITLSDLTQGVVDQVLIIGTPLLSSISGLVWNDANLNGRLFDTESGLAGITVNLLDGQGTIIRSVLTDILGHYQFNDIAAGDYQVQVIRPTGFILSAVNQGSDDSIDSDFDPATGVSDWIHLAITQTQSDVDSGMHNPFPDADAGQMQFILPGDSVVLDGSGSSDQSDDTLTYAWDLDQDGEYDDADTAMPSLSWEDLQAMGIGVGVYTFGLQVTDSFGQTDTSTMNLLVQIDSLVGEIGLAGIIDGAIDAQAYNYQKEKDGTGQSVSSAGDVNGDGYVDYLINVSYKPQNNTSKESFTYTYLVYGKADGTLKLHYLSELFDGGTDGVVFVGKNHRTTNISGTNTIAGGDINGDGFDDLIVGTDYVQEDATREPGGIFDSDGRTYIIYGQATGLTGEINLLDVEAGLVAGAVIDGTVEGQSQSYKYHRVSMAGDVNGDGYADVLIAGYSSTSSSSGELYLIYGQSGLTGTHHVSEIASGQLAGAVFQYSQPIDREAWRISSAGDVNADGLDDFLVSVAGVSHGNVYLIYGQQDGLTGTFSLDQTGSEALPGTHFHFSTNDNAYTISAFSVSTAGDVDNDGYDDFLIGDYRASHDGIYYSGQVLLVYGGLQLQGGNIEADVIGTVAVRGARFNGNSEYDNLGRTVSAGDINGDGYDDILMTYTDYYGNSPGKSAAYVIYGQALGIVGEHNVAEVTQGQLNGFVITDLKPGPFCGFYGDWSLASVGDVNQDGADDILLAGINAFDPYWGSAYLIYGGNKGIIGNQVWNDSNANGLMDDGEEAIAGVRIELLDSQGQVIAQTVTNINGKYWFKSLAPGDYQILVVVPDAYELTEMNIGDDDSLDSDVSTTTALSDWITLQSTRMIDSVDVGLIEKDSNPDFLLFYGSGLELDASRVMGLIDDSLTYTWDTDLDSSFDDATGSTPFLSWNLNHFFMQQDMGLHTIKLKVTDEMGHSSIFASQIMVYPRLHEGTISLDSIDSGDLGGKLIANENVTPNVSLTGDFNGDGFDDLLIRDANAQYQGQATGAVYVVYGDVDGLPEAVTIDDVINGVVDGAVFYSEQHSDDAGAALTNAGDVNGDGYDDILIGAPGANDGAGRTYLIYGSKNLLHGELELADALTNELTATIFEGTSVNSFAGMHVNVAGDVNADGYADFTINDDQLGGSVLVFGTPTATVHGTVWEDYHGVSYPDGVPITVHGLTVDLYKKNESGYYYPFRTTTTDQDGQYRFDALSQDDYFVRIYAASGTYFTSPLGATATRHDFRVSNNFTGLEHNGSLVMIPSINSLSVTSADEGSAVLLEADYDDQSIVLQDFTVEVEWGDGSQSILELDPTDRHFQLDHVYLNDGTYEIKVKLTDITNYSDRVNRTVVIDNVLPAADAGPVYVIGEGTDLLLDASATTDPGNDILTYAWDLDNDGQFDDAIGVSPTVSWATLAALGYTADSIAHPIAVRVSDDDGFKIGSTTLTINPPVAESSITGMAWEDRNYDDLRDAGDVLLADMSVHLYDDQSNLLQTTATDENGVYTFTELIPGNYQVKFFSSFETYRFFVSHDANSNADDDRDSDADAYTGLTDVIELDPYESVEHVDVGYKPTGRLTVNVWLDANANGIFDAGEDAVPGTVTMILDKVDGTYHHQSSFSNSTYRGMLSLAPGEYVVTATLPDGYSMTDANQGADDSVDSDIDPGTLTFTLTLGQDQTHATVGAGVLANGQIGDHLWLDQNENGIKDDGENGIAGQTVNLLNSDGSVYLTTATDANGDYLFDHVIAGDYSVEFTAPPGYQFTLQDVGSDVQIDSDVDPQTGRTSQFTLTANQQITDIDAGLHITSTQAQITITPQSVTEGSSIDLTGTFNHLITAGQSHMVIIDWGDGAGVLLDFEAGVLNFTQSHTYTNDGSKQITIRIADAQIHVDQQDFQVVVTNVLPTVQIGDPYVIDEGTSLILDASDTTDPGSDTLTYAWDLDNDGEYDDATGVSPTLTWSELTALGLSSVGIAQTIGLRVTDDHGSVTQSTTLTINNQLPNVSVDGPYVVYDGYDLTLDASATTDAGDDTLTYEWDLDNDGVYDDATGVSPTITWDTLSSLNITSQGVDYSIAVRVSDDLGSKIASTTFSVLPVPADSSISGVAWEDHNENHVRDQTDPFFANVAVDLYDNEGNLLQSTVSDENGAYSFTGLLPGDYQLFFERINYRLRTYKDYNNNVDDDRDSDVGFSTGFTDLISVGISETLTHVDGGYKPGGYAYMYAWLDPNANGIRDSNEGYTSGTLVSVELEKLDGTYNETFIFNSNTITKLGLRDGDYRVTVTPSEHYVLTLANQGDDDTRDSDVSSETNTAVYTISEADYFLRLDVGLLGIGQIGDRVWLDQNANGIEDAGESGLAGVTVNLLYENGQPCQSTVTDANGNYLFDHVIQGDYIIAFQTPEGSYFTTQDTGADDTIDSDADPLTGRTSVLSLSQSGQIHHVNAGLIATPVLDKVTTSASIAEGVGFDLEGLLSHLDHANQSHFVEIQWGDGETDTFNLTAGELLFDRAHTYANDGTYNISVSVTDSRGEQDQYTGLLTVDNVLPTVDMGGVYVINEGSILVLDASGTTDPGDDALTYAWDLDNDGVYDDATGVGPTLTWPQLTALGLSSDSITQTIGLRVTDDHGSVTQTTTLTINNVLPDADAGDAYVIDEGSGLTLDASGTTDLGSDTLTYAWDLDGDGEFDDALGATPTITWGMLVDLGIPSDGSVLPISLQVSDGTGSVTTFTTLTINNLPPVADAGRPYTINEGQPVTLDASGSSDAGGDVLTYAWDLDNDGVFDDATGESPTISWTGLQALELIDGGYTLAVKVTDGDGATHTDTALLTVTNLNPVANPGGPYTINEGQALVLDASNSSDAGGDTLTYTWDLDSDGVFDDATGVTPTVSWATLQTLGLVDGGYTVKLKVAEAEGVEHVSSTSLNVINLDPIAATTGPYTIDEGQSLTLDASNSSDAGGDTLTYTWDLDNDGTFDDATGVNPTLSWTTLQNMGFDIGTHTMRVHVSDTDGGANILETSLTINQLSSIADSVWQDNNANGIADDGEPSVLGVTVNLRDADDESLLDSQVTDVNGAYLFEYLYPGDYIVEFVLPTDYLFTQQDVGDDDAIDSDADLTTGQTDVITLSDVVTLTNIDAGMMPKFDIVDHHVFYNDTVFDANGTAVDANDNNAISTSKVALLPGQTATVANYTTSRDGLTGFMIDGTDLHVTGLSADDFSFKVGNDSSPDTWIDAPAPSAVVILYGQGVDGSDRIAMSWAAGSITDQWLQVTLKADGNTNLSQDHVFYFGNAIGDMTGDGFTSISDVFRIWSNRAEPGLASMVGPDNDNDLNHDGWVTISDVFMAWANRKEQGIEDGLRMIQPPIIQTVVQDVAVAQSMYVESRLAQSIASMQGRYTLSLTQTDSERYHLTEVPISDYLQN